MDELRPGVPGNEEGRKHPFHRRQIGRIPHHLVGEGLFRLAQDQLAAAAHRKGQRQVRQLPGRFRVPVEPLILPAHLEPDAIASPDAAQERQPRRPQLPVIRLLPHLRDAVGILPEEGVIQQDHQARPDIEKPGARGGRRRNRIRDRKAPVVGHLRPVPLRRPPRHLQRNSLLRQQRLDRHHGREQGGRTPSRSAETGQGRPPCHAAILSLPKRGIAQFQAHGAERHGTRKSSGTVAPWAMRRRRIRHAPSAAWGCDTEWIPHSS